jgi:MFS family permease
VNTPVLVAACVLAVAAAVRSTWSPCGLSMLSTITPLGERGRGRRFSATATWFVLGALLGGATLGAAVTPLARAGRHLSSAAAAGLAAGAAALGAAGDLGLLGYRLPVLRRQVDEQWLDRYRSWVYGAGFGWQIGVGLATYVMTTAVLVTVVLAALTASPAAALAVGVLFGLVRGLAVLLTARVGTPAALLALHRRMEVLRRPVRLAVVGLQLAIGVGLAANASGLGQWDGLAASLVVATVVTIGAAVTLVSAVTHVPAVTDGVVPQTADGTRR